MEKIIDEVAKLQDALNELITPNWKDVRSELDFQIATNQEVAELIDTEYEVEGKKVQLGWKWWKNNNKKLTTDKIDWDEIHIKVFENIKIELVDLLFFTLSGISVCKDNASSIDVELVENDWENIMNITKLQLSSRPNDAASLVVQFAKRLDFNIIAYYFAKHQLNYFRQLDGYKNGSYQKIVGGKEDNEHLHEMIKGISLDDIANDFEGNYNLVSERFYEVFSVEDKDKRYFKDWMEVIS